MIDFSSSKPTLDLNLKIGVFVCVALGVLIITGKFKLILHHHLQHALLTHNCFVSVFAVLVLRRKARSAKLVIDEDESTTDSQFAFSRGLTNNSSGIQEHFNSHFGKVRIFARKIAHQCLGCLVAIVLALCCAAINVIPLVSMEHLKMLLLSFNIYFLN